jgi:hypothetical protein
MYTQVEKRLLTVKPGITDYASIVFADEGDILKNYSDPDIAYNQVIRPYKGQLGLFYIEHSSVWLDLKLIFLTARAIVSREGERGLWLPWCTTFASAAHLLPSWRWLPEKPLFSRLHPLGLIG